MLAGGVGSRFWPVSTPRRPKQLLPLASERPLIVDTLARIEPLVPLERVRVVAGAPLRDPLLEAAPTLRPENLLIEPRARGTAPALAWAASQIRQEDADAAMVSLHADHVIRPAEKFRALLADAARLARETGRLFTIGVRPTRPESGYGYIRVGGKLPGTIAVYDVAEFVEKPDPDTATEYLHRGGYWWNSGIFVWTVSTLLDALAQYTHELRELLPLLESGRVDEFFERAPVLSIDEGLLERCPRVAALEATFEWDDIGAWDAMGRTRAARAGANVAIGDANLIDSEGCIAWADEGSIVVFGGRDLVVVHAHGITFVAPRERAAELKSLLERLPERLRRIE